MEAAPVPDSLCRTKEVLINSKPADVPEECVGSAALYPAAVTL